jgi:hypothetical protein
LKNSTSIKRAGVAGNIVIRPVGKFHRSSWTPGNYCYLWDLFVAESARGLGSGRALEAVYDKAETAGASRVHWLTQTSNAQARIPHDQLADDTGSMQKGSAHV